MHDDDPGDVVHDELAASVWGATPLGRPILGTDESIQAMSRAAVAGYYRRRYLPSSIVVAAAGNVDHAQLVRLVRAAIAGTPLAEGESVPAAPRRGGRTPAFRPGAAVVRRPIEQANLLLATEALARTDERRFALGVLNTALGGGMSSRLFQEIREKRGLAYSVYSFTAQYADTGLFGVSVGCQPERSGEVLSLAREQLADVVAHGLAEDELARGKAQMRGGVVLGMEDTGSRMTRLGKAELVYGELLGLDEVLARIDAVTTEDVRAVAAAVLPGPVGLAAVGPFDDDGFTRAVA